jgi:hypothetical protein
MVMVTATLGSATLMPSSKPHSVDDKIMARFIVLCHRANGHHVTRVVDSRAAH